MTQVRTRFAPSPTGYLHVGGARTALFNWLFARHYGGEFVLRVEDTDAARNTDEAVQAIFDGLRWLELDWDAGPGKDDGRGPYFQSQRTDLYERQLDLLMKADRAYVDDGGAVRFRVPDEPVTVSDKICGSRTVNLKEEGSTCYDPETRQNVAVNPDFVIRRADGSFLFHFVNVVDDIAMAITHVIRGGDHLANTPKHVALFEALGSPIPEFAHIPLILNKNGSKMSKRDEGASMDTYIRDGFLPSAVRNYLSLLGWSPKDDREKMPIEDIIALFDYDHLNHANAKFDMEKCQWLNSQYLADLDAGAFVKLARDWMASTGEQGWLQENSATVDAALRVMRPKIKHLPEIRDHWPRFFVDDGIDLEAAAKVAADPSAKLQLDVVLRHLAIVEHWNEDAITEALDAAAEELGIKKGKFMFGLRVLATGAAQGTDLLPTLAVVGSERMLHRLGRRLAEIFP
ncbi:MAG: glutamate--tRNA ligase family protein [Verrucomicrobia bacterium]|nr:glutamate--tRNA ligase family protein [Verrucomicrobiota bacterium]